MRATSRPRNSERYALRPAEFFVLRTPLLPFDDWIAWNHGLTAAALDAPDDAALSRALEQDRSQLWSRLRDITARPAIRHALYFGAPGVMKRLDQSVAADVKANDRDRLTLVRYFARMTGRPTPFGLFAGCSMGRVGGVANLAIASSGHYKVFTTVDVGFLHDAMREAEARLADVMKLWVRPNPTIYRVDGHIRFVEVRTDPQTGKRDYHLAAVPATECLEHVLAAAAGQCRLGGLARHLQDSAHRVPPQTARNFVSTMFANGLLESTLEPGLTGSEPLTDVIGRLAGIRDPATDQLRTALQAGQSALRAIDRRGVGVSPDHLDHVVADLRHASPNVQPSPLLQADLFKPAPQAVLSTGITAAIRDAALLLHRITPYRVPQALARFAEAFSARYQDGAVPLLTVLDDAFGIGLPDDGAAEEESPWLTGLPPLPAAAAVWDRRDLHLTNRVLAAVAAGETCVELGADDIAALQNRVLTPLPPCFAAVATLGAPSASALQRDDAQILLHGLVGPSGAEFLGRFGHGSAEINLAVGAWLAAEETLYPGAVVAEIIHLPQGRSGNIICRPAWRRFEILCLGQSAAAREDQIPVSDLLVSMVQGRVVLWSRRLNCEIVPRLTSADYAPTADLTVYRFLWLLQKQEAAALEWQWGTLGAAPFLPRVCAGNVVLSRARWRLDLSDIARPGRDIRAAFGALKELRCRHKIPRRVSMIEGEKALPLDLDNVICVELLLHASRGGRPTTLMEQYPAQDALCVTSTEGRFVHEIILPFRSDPISPNRDTPPMLPPRADRPLRSAYAPGSEWLYIKIYGSLPVLEDLLLTVFGPTICELKARADVHSWFFIRYLDPEPHLRIRLHGLPPLLLREALPTLHTVMRPLLDSGKIRSVQLDTYLPEIERYGGPLAIGAIESFFASDSGAALALLALDPRRTGDTREHLAVARVAALLDGFGLTGHAREDFTRRVRDSLLSEMALTNVEAASFGAHYRRVRHVLRDLIHPSMQAGAASGNPGWIGQARQVLAEQAAAVLSLDRHLLQLERARQLTRPRVDIVASVAHMSINRLMRSEPRRVELAVYDLLHRLTVAELARR